MLFIRRHNMASQYKGVVQLQRLLLVLCKNSSEVNRIICRIMLKNDFGILHY